MTAGIPFGHFILTRRLARGGMAEVFLARQRGLEGFDRRVAVKRILPHLSERPDFVNMFLDEARLAARLSHPNIVHIYEFGKVDDDYFIAMEYVDGIHAGQMLRTRMPPVMVARIGADAASALAYAHRLEDADGRSLALVHRDISPQNLLISYDGVVKLVDFGIAKAIAQDSETRPGVVKGKYAYMSPEQTVGKSLDGRSDVFSLALVLWELLAGRHVIERGDPVEGMRAIRDGRFPPIEEVAPDVPAPLAAALGEALAVDRDERATAAELGVALEAFIKSSPELATSMQLADWIRGKFPRAPISDPAVPAIERGTRTRATQVGSASAPAVALPAREATIMHTALPADVSAVPDREDADDDPTAIVAPVDEAPRARPRRRRAIWPWLLAGALGLGGGLALLLTRREEPPRVAAPPPDAARPTVIAIAPDAAPRPDAAVAPRPASLDVITTPAGATVRLGDRAPANTPATFLDLGAGELTVHVALAGYLSEDRTVTVAPGERRTLELELVAEKRAPPPPPHVVHKAAPGTLNVRTDPYSVVYDGSRKLGETPFVISLPAGTYHLRFVNPKRGAQTRTVIIKSGATTKLKLAL